MKHFKLTILLTVLISMVGVKALADTFMVDGIKYVTTSASTVKVVANSFSKYISIPASVTYEATTYSVTTIGDYAFSGCSGLTSIEIPNSVTSIGEGAFEYCSNLTSIEIPNSVTTIGDYAFSGCSGLTSIEIPNSVTSIGEWAFYYCSGLTSITIPNGVTSIGNAAFENCSGLTSIMVPNGVTSIGEGAFYYCSGLTSITVDSENTKYDSRDNCNAIIETASNTLIAGCKATIIPNSVTTIGEGAFWGCSGLTSIEIPNSVTSIGDGAFIECYGLTSIEIPNSVTSIGDYEFKGCSNLTSITVDSENTKYDSRDNCNAIIETASNTLIAGCKTTIIPNSVTSIGNTAFEDCYGLTSIEIPNSVTSIGNAAFEDCFGLTSIEIPNSVTSIGNYAFYCCFDLTSIEIPNSVTSIGDNAFEDCSGLTSIEIPNSVTSIGVSAFHYTPWYNNQSDGMVYAGKVAYEYKGTMPANTNITIEEGTLGIAGAAFWGCSGLTSIEIPNSVTSIGNGAFRGCAGLTSIEIPNSVTSIGDYAFDCCYSLFTIVSLIENPFRIADNVFLKDNATLYIPIGTKDKYKSTEGWKDFVRIEEGVPAGIQDIKQETTTTVSRYYNLNGQETSQPRKGINIMKMSDGKTKKVLVK